jgi:hypothetical protein
MFADPSSPSTTVQLPGLTTMATWLVAGTIFTCNRLDTLVHFINESQDVTVKCCTHHKPELKDLCGDVWSEDDHTGVAA